MGQYIQSFDAMCLSSSRSAPALNLVQHKPRNPPTVNMLYAPQLPHPTRCKSLCPCPGRNPKHLGTQPIYANMFPFSILVPEYVPHSYMDLWVSLDPKPQTLNPKPCEPKVKEEFRILAALKQKQEQSDAWLHVRHAV